MESDVIVCLHGYHQMAGGRGFEVVMRDRIKTVHTTADAFSRLGASVGIIFLGGHGDDEAQAAHQAHRLREYTETIDPHLLQTYPHELADHRSGNTREDIVALAEHLRKHDYAPQFVISVSSSDHAPRIQRLWSELQSSGIADSTYIATAVASNKTYAESGVPPFILEAARFEPFILPFNELWNLDPEVYEEAANEIHEVLQKYQ